MKIIKSPNVEFFLDKMHLKNYPSGKIYKAHVVKVDVFSKSDIEELEANGYISEPNEEPDIDEEADANVPATKYICNGDASKLDANKKIATKPPPTP